MKTTASHKQTEQKRTYLSWEYEQFSSYFKSDSSLRVSQRCVCLATGFLTLQVQLPVLRPHLRRGITAYYSSTNNSLSAHQPAGSQTQATEKGVRGVTLAPACANSRLLTFYWWLIHYLENSFASRRFLSCPQLSTQYRSALASYFLCPFFHPSSFVWFVLFHLLNRAFIPSSIFPATSIKPLYTEPQPAWILLSCSWHLILLPEDVSQDVTALSWLVVTTKNACDAKCYLFNPLKALAFPRKALKICPLHQKHLCHESSVDTVPQL